MARYFPGGRITRIHGQPKRADGRIYFPMFHPAAVLRDPRRRPEMEADMRHVLELINEAERNAPPDEPRSDEPDDYVQLNLF
jgi:DNA polymerase